MDKETKRELQHITRELEDIKTEMRELNEIMENTHNFTYFMEVIWEDGYKSGKNEIEN